MITPNDAPIMPVVQMKARLVRLKSSLAALVEQDFANPLLLLTDAVRCSRV